MSDVMKRVEQIDDKIGDKKPMYISREDFMHETAEGDMEFLISTIKQLHAENERYKKALEEITNVGWSNAFGGGIQYSGESHGDCRKIAKEALATDEPEYDESARAYELDGEFK